MKLTTTLIVLASLSFGTVANAAIDSYMKIVPAKGEFKGGSGISKSGNIPMLGYTMPTEKAEGAASGLPTGQRQHKPILIKLQALEAPPFVHALGAKQQLRSVTIFVLHYLPGSKSQVVQQITLTNVVVTSVVAGAPVNGGNSVNAKYVNVTFEYGGLILNNTKGPITASNAWMN